MKPELERYTALIRSWPANLVSRDDLERLEAHVDDSLIGAPTLERLGARHIVDVGSGAGFPALPLCLADPRLQMELVESRERKAAFLRSAAEALGVPDRLRVHQARAEEAVGALGREFADVATCRALAAPPVAAELLAPFVRVGGSLVLWSTRALAASVAGRALPELGLDDPPLLEDRASRLRTDGVLIVWRKTSVASHRFPRRTGVAARKPLA